MQNGKARRLHAGQELAWAREQLKKAVDAAKEVAVQDAHDGVPEAVIARDLGISRLTVRHWIGK